MSINRICYILGAGFSKACGLPLARELTELVVRYRRRDVTNGTDPSPPRLVPGSFGFEQESQELQLIRRLMPGHACSFGDAGSWPDFEVLLTVLDDAAKFERDVVSVHAKGPQLAMDRLRRQMMSNLRGMLGENIGALRNEQRALLANFIAQVRAGFDSIVSFNWDTLIEIAAAASSLKTSNDGTGAALSLIKPHGSLDLVELTEDRWEEIRSSSNAIKLNVVARYEIGSRKHVLLRCEDPASVADRIDGVFGDALLVAPNRRKEYLSPWIRDQWKIALRLIREADEIRIIGFSFPEADVRPQLALNWGVGGGAAPRRLTLIDPTTDDQVAKRIEAIAGQPVQHVRSNWQNWIELHRKRSATV